MSPLVSFFTAVLFVVSIGSVCSAEALAIPRGLSLIRSCMLASTLQDAFRRMPRSADYDQLSASAEKLLRWNWDRLVADATRLSGDVGLVGLDGLPPPLADVCSQLRGALKVCSSNGEALKRNYRHSSCQGTTLRSVAGCSPQAQVACSLSTDSSCHTATSTFLYSQ